jgi:hypothetical protein
MNRPAKHSKELAGATAEDSRRQAIDDAKKRAVSQHADYDTFKKLVRYDCNSYGLQVWLAVHYRGRAQLTRCAAALLY